MIKKLISIFTISGVIFALPMQIGETMDDFTVPYCLNGNGDFNYYSECNGAQNGGNYKIFWMNVHASW